ncbi:MAG TPA: VWA-like domain-containing protein [Pseudonocardiaceae bacterium]|jgi:predicted metal-dependent peptidase|nr:VWA-like domain-containing protein [Pseudonocardiaceae bacterium]
MTPRLSGIHVLALPQRQKWAAARVWTARRAPYLASAVLALQPYVVEQSDGERYDLRAFPVDLAWHVYLDPAVLDATEVPRIGFWLLHQVTHLLRRHAKRYPGADTDAVGDQFTRRSPEQVRWNLACDAEINDDLHADDLPLPARAITPTRLMLPDSWLAEQYWDVLHEDAPALVDQVDCGSGVDGRPRDWDSGEPGLGESGQKLLGRDVARRIREHSRTRGDIPEGWQRWADEVLEPVVDWRRLLRSALRRGVADIAGRVDFTYRRPSRRAAALPGVILPSLRQPLPTVAVVIDTSGSMSDDMLAQVLGEVAGLLTSVGIGRNRLHVVCCDAEAYAAQRVLNAHEVRLLGGGGTDMGAGLAATQDLRPRPDLVIVLTDGHTPWPSAPPGKARVLVGLMDPTGSTPPWADVVGIEPTPAVGR